MMQHPEAKTRDGYDDSAKSLRAKENSLTRSNASTSQATEPLIATNLKLVQRGQSSD